MYIDTHCHLYLIDSGDELGDIIARALEADVQNMIVPGIDIDSSKKARQMASENPHIHAAVGFHPNHIRGADLETLGELSELIMRPEVVAVGEIGLDYYRNKQTASDQLRVFEHLLSVANQEAKPVIIHSRAAAEDTLELIRLYKSDGLRGVWHCFDGDWNLAERILDLGFYLGFTGSITFTKNKELADVVSKMPADRILIETDSPYLAPLAHRGDINEPAYVVEVARKIAEIKEMDIAEVGQLTSENAQKLFNI